MADDGTFSIDAAVARLGDHEDKSVSNGRFYSNKAPGLAFAAYPVYRLLRLVLPPPEPGTGSPIFFLDAPPDRLARLPARAAPLRRAPGGAPGRPRQSVSSCLAVALGTPFLFYARSFFSHAWTAALLFLSWDRLRRAEERNGSGRGAQTAAVAGLLAGWAVLSEYSVAPLALALGVRAVATRSGRRLTGFVLGAAVPAALLAAYDAICFGSPWTLSSAREASPDYAALAGSGVFGFRLPSPRIAFAYLLDPARGVLLFSPFLLWTVAGLVAWWRRGDDRRDWWMVAGGLGFLLRLSLRIPELARRLEPREPVPAARSLLRGSADRRRARATAVARSVRRGGGVLRRRRPRAPASMAALPAGDAVARGRRARSGF